MSYALSVYLVPRAILDRVYGKNDTALLDEALAEIGGDLADYDEQLGAPDRDDDADLSHADALREIFAGDFTEDVRGSRYGWSFECLCRFIGEWLSNEGFSPCKTDWYQHLDALLASHGVPVRFQDLISDPPLPIPESDDWPCVGHWAAEAVAQADALAQLLPRVEGRAEKRALETALGWLRAAADQPGSVIVGFHG